MRKIALVILMLMSTAAWAEKVIKFETKKERNQFINDYLPTVGYERPCKTVVYETIGKQYVFCTSAIKDDRVVIMDKIDSLTVKILSVLEYEKFHNGLYKEDWDARMKDVKQREAERNARLARYGL